MLLLTARNLSKSFCKIVKIPPSSRYSTFITHEIMHPFLIHVFPVSFLSTLNRFSLTPIMPMLCFISNSEQRSKVFKTGPSKNSGRQSGLFTQAVSFQIF